MALDNFDFGAEVAAAAGGAKRVNPEVGLHMARLKSIIHLGTIVSIYKGKPKPPVNKVAAIFELKGGEDVDDLHPETGEPLTIGMNFNLIQGDNSVLNKMFLPALVTKKEFEEGTVKGFDDLIGRCCQLNLKGSKALDEDGKHKYVDIENMSAVMKAVAAGVPEIVNKGVGHCKLPDLTIEALDELNVYIDVQQNIMVSEQWKDGTHPAIALVEEIRKERPNYAKAQKSDEESAEGQQQPSQPAAPAEKLAEDEEF